LDTPFQEEVTIMQHALRFFSGPFYHFSIISLLTVLLCINPARADTETLVSGIAGATGSTVGPDGYLYVTAGTGNVFKIDPVTGDTVVFAQNLPPGAGFGGPTDIAFLEETAYVLVTFVNPFDPFSSPINGIYRIDDLDTATPIANLGLFSASNLPTDFDWFIPTGVHWAIEAFHGKLYVTDGHHNRILEVSTDGQIGEFIAFGNIVPAGLEISENQLFMARTGPTPHLAEEGKILAIGHKAESVLEQGSGAPLLLDVEFGRGRSLYALSQGEWDGAFPGSPALPFDGALWEVDLDGSLHLIEDDLNLPNSLEVIGNDAYIVTLTGDVLVVREISDAPFGKSKGRNK
jgi:hypothetical protein